MERPAAGFYRHFKGARYEVLHVARHSETGEELVIYRPVAEPELVFARPLAMWSETVVREGRATPRFVRDDG